MTNNSNSRQQLPDTTGCVHQWEPMADVPENIQHFNFEQCARCKHVRSDLTPFPPLKPTEDEVEYGKEVARRIEHKELQKRYEYLYATWCKDTKEAAQQINALWEAMHIARENGALSLPYSDWIDEAEEAIKTRDHEALLEIMKRLQQ